MVMKTGLHLSFGLLLAVTLVGIPLAFANEEQVKKVNGEIDTFTTKVKKAFEEPADSEKNKFTAGENDTIRSIVIQIEQRQEALAVKLRELKREHEFLA